LKVLLFSHTFLPTIGGRELVVHHLADALDRLGHDVRVFGPAGWWQHRHNHFRYPVVRHPNLLRFPFRARGLSRRIRERQLGWHLQWEVARQGIDVVHAHTTYPTGYIATRVFSHLPVVLTPHGVDIDTIPQMGYGLRLDADLKPRIDQALERATAITAISEGIHTSLRSAGADDARIFDVPNGVDLVRFRGPPSSDVRGRLGLQPETKLIVTVGNFHPRKGHDLLIRAMRSISHAHPDARLVIVGRGTEGLAPLIGELGLRDKVILTGSVALPATFRCSAVPGNGGEDLLADILKSASVAVSAGISEGAEGLSLAVLEAMAAGVPLVATRITGNRDIVQSGQNGYLIEPSNVTALAESICTVLALEDEGRAMGSAGRALVAGRYSWEAVANQYLEVYEWARLRTVSSQPQRKGTAQRYGDSA